MRTDRTRGAPVRVVDGATLALLVGVLSIPALGFGGKAYWARAWIQFAAGLLGALFAARLVLGFPFGERRVLGLPGVLALGLAFWLGLQVLPLPPKLLGALSPRTFDLYGLALPGWPDAAPFGEIFSAVERKAPELGFGAAFGFPPSWRPLSVAPAETLEGLLLGASYVLVAVTAATYPWPRDGIRALELCIGSFLVLALAEALYALFQYGAARGRIFWYECPKRSSCTGTYLNRNHYAGLLAAAVPLYAGRAWARWRDGSSGSRRNGLLGGFLARASTARGAGALALGIAGFFLFCSLVASASRGAFVALLGAAALAWTLLAGGSRTRSPWLPWVCAALAVFVWFFFPQSSARIAGGDFVRKEIARDSLALVSDFPLFGVGLGGFSRAFSLYRKATTEKWPHGVTHAHNDVLEWTSEAGIPGLVLAAALGWLFLRFVRGQFGGLSSGHKGILCASLFVAVLAIGIHSFFDFGLHLPANAVVFAFLLGAAIRVAKGRPQAGTFQLSIPLWLVALALGLSGAGLSLLACKRARAEGALRQVVPELPVRSLLSGSPDALDPVSRFVLVERAARELPWVPEFQVHLGDQYLENRYRLAGTPLEASLALDAAALAYTRALWLDPLQPSVHLRLLRAIEPVYGVDPGTEPGVLFDLAGRAAALAPYDAVVRLQVAEWSLGQWRHLPPSARREAEERARAALELTAEMPVFERARERVARLYRERRRG